MRAIFGGAASRDSTRTLSAPLPVNLYPDDDGENDCLGINQTFNPHLACCHCQSDGRNLSVHLSPPGSPHGHQSHTPHLRLHNPASIIRLNMPSD